MSGEKKLLPGEIPAGIMEYILRSLQEICYGQVVLIAQDARLVQVERNEKLRVTDCRMCRERKPIAAVELQCLQERIHQSFRNLAYGQLVIIIKAGSVVQMERTEKRRFTGLDGEGI